MNEDINSSAVKQFLTHFHSELCDQLGDLDGKASFGNDIWTRTEGGGGNTRTVVEGDLFEKGGVAFSHIHGDKLPPSASATRPELAGRKYQAMGVSLVLHTQNPHVPCTHMNVRFFFAEKPGEPTIWWFGGGFDLTPYYGYEEDCHHWHTMAKKACDPFGAELYDQFKSNCDHYFYLPHRQEARGVGGLFYDDYNGDGFEHAFGLTQSVATHFYKAYSPIAQKRRTENYTDEQKQFQCYRRGRYTEFNLLQDRGTLFGIQSGGRTESILMSLPPTAHWWYQPKFEPGTPEYELTEKFLQAKQWVQ